MKFIRQLDVTEKHPELTKSVINHYRKTFLFAEPTKYSGQTPMWSIESAEKSVEMVKRYRELGQSHKSPPPDLLEWIELNRRSKECVYDRAMRLMKPVSC